MRGELRSDPGFYLLKAARRTDPDVSDSLAKAELPLSAFGSLVAEGLSC